MKSLYFLWIALGLGLLLMLVLLNTGGLNTDEAPALPVLTQLFMAEFGFFVTAGGAFAGIRHWLAQRNDTRVLFAGVGAAILCVCFFLIGVILWKGFVA